MADNLIVKDAAGTNQPVQISVEMYRSAEEAGQSLPQYLNSQHPTNVQRDGTAFQQLMEQCGIFVRADTDFGIRPTRIEDILNPKDAASNVVTKEGVPVSRTLFPAVLLGVIEDKVQYDWKQNVDGFEKMVAQDDFINGDRFERPVISYAQVEKARGAPVAQLSEPNAILKITSSDRFQRIPSWGIGMEISEQAMKATTLDLVGLIMARQMLVESNARADAHILSMLQGDVDTGFGGSALSSIPGKVRTAASFDPSITQNGVLTQRAWVKYLSNNSRKRRITHIVTDIDTALAIETRTGRPTNFNDDPNSPRIDTLQSIMNPKWPTNVQVFLTDDPNWPANTIMGFDQRQGIHRVTSLSAQYSAVEQFAMRRSTQMRIDRGDYAYRLFDEAFDVLTLTV